jgi:starch-binding outer membrane protein, SusD/RagB family
MITIRNVPVLAAFALGACNLDVTNPGPIPDDALNVAEAVPGLVTGMSSDLSESLADIVYGTVIMADELAHGGSYTAEGLWYRGIIHPEDVNGFWADMARARWVSEQGIERIREIERKEIERGREIVLYETVHGARANLYAGFANRLAGENSCEAIIDGGPAQAHTVYFERALDYFEEAERIARLVNQTALIRAASGARATVSAWLGDWAGAVQDAATIPTSYRFDAIYSTNSDRESNTLPSESNNTRAGGRREFTVYSTIWAERDPNDPRAPWSIPLDNGGVPLKGQDGKTIFYQQEKYQALDDDIALLKGTEMRLLQAEDALRRGDIATAFAFINESRAQYELPALPVAATVADAWPVLQIERGAELWLEARRFWDLRRWNAETGPAHHAFLDSRDKCIPISLAERQSNPNVR